MLRRGAPGEYGSVGALAGNAGSVVEGVGIVAAHAAELDVVSVLVACRGLHVGANVPFHVSLGPATNASSVTDLADILEELVAESALDVLTLDATPPSGLAGEAELVVGKLAADPPLGDELLVLVGVGPAVYNLDPAHDEGHTVAPAVDDAQRSVDLDQGPVEVPSDECLVCNDGQAHGNKDDEA